MNSKVLILALSLSPLMASAATPWVKWGNGYMRLEDDGNLACARYGNTRDCSWTATVAPAATARSLACGPQSQKEWGITGYDTFGHWCNRAYADLYADWKLGSHAGFDVFLAENPAGDLMCASSNGRDCRWWPPVTATEPTKPISPVVCGPLAKEQWGNEVTAPDHWCQQARVMVDQRDYDDPKWDTETFKYERGWAGMGFGLTGTQRGAPESMRIAYRNGRRGLGIKSVTRDAQWLQRYPEGIYSTADRELQDDLFMYAKRPWRADDEPTLVMRIYRPKGTTVSLRMPVIYTNDGEPDKRWPGIWLRADGIRLRTVLRDYRIADANLENADGRWWTLGLKVTKDGDIEYYAAADWRASPFDASFFRGKQSALLGSTAYTITRQADATVMISNVLPDGAEAIIGDIRYGMKTKAQKLTP